MENFNVGEIIWAKIRGYPWWPATITGTKDDSREKMYRVSFIGDKTFANLPKKFLAKFEKEFKNYSNTKQKKLVESIKEAKKMFNNKTTRGTFLKLKKKSDNDDKSSIDNDNENDNDDNDSSISSGGNEEENDNSSFINKKRKKSLGVSVSKAKKTVSSSKHKISKVNSSSLVSLKDKSGLEIIKKIISYLIYIAKIVEKKEFNKLKEENECLMKVLEFLRDYKMVDPIDFLKKTNIGQLIKYINTNLPENDLKQFTGEIYKSLEEQVLSQLFQKTK